MSVPSVAFNRAAVPIAVLRAPSELAKALAPTATFSVPVTDLLRAFLPTAVFYPPTVAVCSAPLPTAVLLSAVVA